MYSHSLRFLAWERSEQSFSWSPEGVELTCSIARIVPSLYLFPAAAPIQPGRQGLPVTGTDSISVPTYSLPRVYVLLLFYVGVCCHRGGVVVRRYVTVFQSGTAEHEVWAPDLFERYFSLYFRHCWLLPFCFRCSPV